MTFPLMNVGIKRSLVAAKLNLIRYRFFIKVLSPRMLKALKWDFFLFYLNRDSVVLERISPTIFFFMRRVNVYNRNSDQNVIRGNLPRVAEISPPGKCLSSLNESERVGSLFAQLKTFAFESVWSEIKCSGIIKREGKTIRPDNYNSSWKAK